MTRVSCDHTALPDIRAPSLCLSLVRAPTEDRRPPPGPETADRQPTAPRRRAARDRQTPSPLRNAMNDALRTNVFVRFSPETVAAACIYLSARVKRVPLPSRPHWFTVFGMREEELREIATAILKLYSRAKVMEASSSIVGR